MTASVDRGRLCVEEIDLSLMYVDSFIEAKLGLDAI